MRKTPAHRIALPHFLRRNLAKYDTFRELKVSRNRDVYQMQNKLVSDGSRTHHCSVLIPIATKLLWIKRNRCISTRSTTGSQKMNERKVSVNMTGQAIRFIALVKRIRTFTTNNVDNLIA